MSVTVSQQCRTAALALSAASWFCCDGSARRGLAVAHRFAKLVARRYYPQHNVQAVAALPWETAAGPLAAAPRAAPKS